MSLEARVQDLVRTLGEAPAFEQRGRVRGAIGTSIRVAGLSARIGQTCALLDRDGAEVLSAEVVGLADGEVLLSPLGDLRGLSSETEVVVRVGEDRVPVGPALLGRVVDARLRPLDGGPAIEGDGFRPLYGESPNPMSRARIDTAVETGVRAIDGLMPLGRGQRMGVFAAAGGGKSTLLATLARQTRADAVVIALIGERGREVREFVEDNLGAEGLSRSVVVVATSDRPALERARAAHAATAVAEGLRAEGRHVLLLMDSVTRFARALREIGLASGEPPVRRGFPPSVFAELPRLFERAGADDRGAITALYTVLLEDEVDDPVGEEVRSLLDGHIHLSRKLGACGHYPAIDVLGSLSRLMPQLADAAQQSSATALRAHLAKLAEIEILLQVGDYKPGQDAAADRAIAAREAIDAFLRQPHDQPVAVATTQALLRSFG
ncbi:flagellum-specific ATP synthase FliI [Sphingomonas spermidinifaciens]|uniref:Flagellum-specific ATP synthase FliI n=1 Tax=Sphingomonas spermidinifaciens TaxID=1141889 RepID=A0A2A4B5I3_9SPHN|nr:FliI/YscN family ATPase [Sphingomonas spermidinifaciens]PCD03212.1 flagellum-specific ATP synthase FliI [Sphingomonas spermidinifaciens]